MYAIDAVSCGDAYTDAATLGPVFGSNGGYFIVSGNDAFVQLGYGDYGRWQWMQEAHITPGNGILYRGTIAVRFRNHAAGQVAVATAALATAVEPQPFGSLGTMGVASAAGTPAGVLLPPLAAMLPDGSAGNLAPQRLRVQGTEANPKKVFPVLAFDGAGSITESAFWTFKLPADYVSAGTVTILWFLNATANAVKWQAMIGAVSPGDLSTPIAHAPAGASATVTSVPAAGANILARTQIVLAALDSLAAGDLVFLCVFRDSADGQDTATQDANYVSGSFTYS